jgi:hypothetical protein
MSFVEDDEQLPDVTALTPDEYADMVLAAVEFAEELGLDPSEWDVSAV